MAQQGNYDLKLNTVDGQPRSFPGNGSPDQFHRFVIAFPNPFASPPLVHLGVTGVHAVGDVDTNWKATQGFYILVEEVTATQFTIRTQISWYNKAFSVQIAWIALDS